MVLILAEKDDTHAKLVTEGLIAEGTSVQCFSTADFTIDQQIALTYADNRSSLSLFSDGKRVALDDVTTVWNRRFKTPLLSDELADSDRSFAHAENMHMLKGLWHYLSDRVWINPYLPAVAAECKPYQLKVAAASGFEIPKTVMTNSAAEALEFFDNCIGGVIYKPFGMYGIHAPTSGKTVYTTLLTRQDLVRHGERLAIAPGIFQEYVEKSVELRVTVIGDRIFSTEIQSQATEKTRQDWRRYDLENTPHMPHTLSPATEEKVRLLMRNLGLTFGGIDIIVTPGGREVFLEINQAGQWYWIELMTGQPLLGAFVQLLSSTAVAK